MWTMSNPEGSATASAPADDSSTSASNNNTETFRETDETFKYILRYDHDNETVKGVTFTHAEHEDYFTKPGLVLYDQKHWKEMMPFTTDFYVKSSTGVVYMPKPGTIDELAKKYGELQFGKKTDEPKTDPELFWKCIYILNAVVANARPGKYWFKKEMAGFRKGQWKKRYRTTLENTITTLGYFYMEGVFGYPIEGKGISMKEILLCLEADPETIYGPGQGRAGGPTVSTPEPSSAADSVSTPEELSTAIAQINEFVLNSYKGHTAVAMKEKVRRWAEFTDYAQQEFSVIDAEHEATKWTFDRNKLVSKALSNLRDEPKRKNPNGVFSNAGIFRYRDHPDMKNGDTGCVYVKGNYFPTFQVWDRATGWLLHDQRNESNVTRNQNNVMNSLTDPQWEMMDLAFRSKHRLADPKKGAAILKARKKERKDKIDAALRSAATKRKTESADARTKRTRRTIVATYKFSESFLTDEKKVFLEGSSDEVASVMAEPDFTAKFSCLGGVSALDDRFFCLACVLLHKKGLLDMALDKDGNPCTNVGSMVTHLFEDSQKKVPAVAPQQKPPARMGAGTKKTSPAAAQQKPPAQMEVGTKKTSPAQTQAAQMQTPAQKNAAEKKASGSEKKKGGKKKGKDVAEGDKKKDSWDTESEDEGAA